MKIAALSDIHGNLFALEAVLEDARRRAVDLTVNLGDIVSGALLPAETAERLMTLDLPTIRGNHERQLLAADIDRMGASDRHARDRLTPSQRVWLKALPGVLHPADGVFMCHATPYNDVDCYLEDLVDGELRAAPLRRVEERTRGCAAPLILCGHSHIPRIVRLRTGQIVVNPGSVGIQAYEGHDPGPHVVQIGSPHARYAVLESTRWGWQADLVAVAYDWEEAAKVAVRHGRDDWARALVSGFARTD